MKKTILPFLAILVLLFISACSNQDVLPDLIPESNPETTGRTLTFKALIPADDPSTRVSLEEIENRAIDFKWEDGDQIDLLYVQDGVEDNGTGVVTEVSTDGKEATFYMSSVPDGINLENPFSLYGVYGGAGVSSENSALVKLRTIEIEGLTELNSKQDVVLRFNLENYTATPGETPAVQFNHVGFMFTVNIKVTGDLETSFTDITKVKLVEVDEAGNPVMENIDDYYINLKTGAFVNLNNSDANSFSFQYAEKNSEKSIITVRNWFPATDEIWPTLKLSISRSSSAVDALTNRITPTGKTLVVAGSYYLYATWDGADALEFVNKAEMEPKGSKENPYSVAEAISDVYVDGIVVKDKWIRGFIVGSYNNGSIFGVDNASQYNINIADDKATTVEADVINIQLTTTIPPSSTKNVRATFNLIDNPGMYKSEVLFKGDIEKYNGLPGLKQTSDFVIISTTPLFEADNTPINFTSSLELTRTITITTNDTQAWTATSSDESWLTVAPASGTGSGDVTITATENTDTEAGRTATVTLTAIDNAELAPIVIDVTQDKLVSLIDVDPTAIAFTTASGSKTLTVNSNVTWTASATIIDGAPDWLTITPTTGNSGQTTISATATENTTFAARSATINITDGAGISIDVAVTQEAVIPFLKVDPTVLALDKETATNVPVAITANVTWTAAVNTEATWLTISPANGVNDGTILVSAEANNGADARNATITITPEASSGLPAIEYSVTQAGLTAVFAETLFFSEYIEGSSDNKYLEIYNGTGVSVNLSDYKIVQYNNGKSTATYTLELSGTLEHDKVYVIANSKATIYSGTSDLTTTSSVMVFNGDDALALVKTTNGNDEYIDIFGEIGDDPGSAWTATGGYSTANKTLVRKSHIKKGVIVNPTPKGIGFTTLDTEWDVYDQDTTTYLGSHSTSY